MQEVNITTRGLRHLHGISVRILHLTEFGSLYQITNRLYHSRPLRKSHHQKLSEPMYRSTKKGFCRSAAGTVNVGKHKLNCDGEQTQTVFRPTRASVGAQNTCFRQVGLRVHERCFCPCSAQLRSCRRSRHCCRPWPG